MINIVVSLSYILLFCSLSFAEPPTPNAKSYGAWQREQLLKQKQAKNKNNRYVNMYDFQKHTISAAEVSTRIIDNSTKVSDLTTEKKLRVDALNQKMAEEAAKPYPNEYILNSLHDQINHEEGALRDLNIVRSTRRGEYLGENRGGYYGEYNRGYYGEYNR